MQNVQEQKIKQQEERHQTEMSDLLVSIQAQLDNNSAAVNRKILRTQEAIQQMILKSQETIFAKMAELTEIINQIGDRLTSKAEHGNLNLGKDTNMEPVTPQKVSRPEFASSGSKNKKTESHRKPEQPPKQATDKLNLTGGTFPHTHSQQKHLTKKTYVTRTQKKHQ